MSELLAVVSSGGLQSEAQTAPIALVGIMVGLLFGCLACWTVAGQKVRDGGLLLAWEKRRAVPWNVIDVLCVVLAALVGVFCGIGCFSLFGKTPVEPAEGETLSAIQQVFVMLALELGLLFGLVLAIAHLVYRAKATIIDLGLSVSQLRQDLWLGMVTFLMITTPVLLCQAALSVLFPDAGVHPFLELLREEGNDHILGVIFVVAVLLAPPIEEFLFRVVIQGWLERFVLALSTDSDRMKSTPEAIVDEPRSEVADAQLVAAPHRHFNPLTSREDLHFPIPASPLLSWLPISIASLLFALAHFGQGTAPIPLFFLSLGLGFIYQRTHRIWPSMVTHMLVNGLAVLQLKIAIDSGMSI